MFKVGDSVRATESVYHGFRSGDVGIVDSVAYLFDNAVYTVNGYPFYATELEFAK
jgi:hypothetical protein